MQSRIKSPSSGFKKQLKAGKLRAELHDLIGVRIIAHTVATMENASSSLNATISNQKETQALYRLRELVSTMRGWENSEDRCKDYIRHPKPSG